MKKLAFGLLLILLAPCTSIAQEKKFPQGVAVEISALFCLEQSDAQAVADAKGNATPEIRILVMTGKCREMSGVAVYVKEVYRNGEWSVWELRSGNIPTFYEATDWTSFKPRPKGSIEI